MSEENSGASIMKKCFFAILTIFAVLPSFSNAEVNTKGVQDVRVVNLPETQKVDGAVEVKGLIRHSFTDRKEHIIVPTSQRESIDSLTYAGRIQTDGFTSIVLSLQGEVQSDTFSAGKVGALLIPAEKPILRAFNTDKTILFPLEINTDVTPGASPYFTSKSSKQVVGFPEYLVYLYNSTSKNVELNLYMYLTN